MFYSHLFACHLTQKIVIKNGIIIGHKNSKSKKYLTFANISNKSISAITYHSVTNYSIVPSISTRVRVTDTDLNKYKIIINIASRCRFAHFLTLHLSTQILVECVKTIECANSAKIPQS